MKNGKIKRQKTNTIKIKDLRFILNSRGHRSCNFIFDTVGVFSNLKPDQQNELTDNKGIS